MEKQLTVDGLALTWLRAPADAWCDGHVVGVTAAAGSDIFRAPDGQSVNDTAALALTAAPKADWQFQARVRVNHRASWDAGTVVVWGDERHWAKVCFEFSPQGQPTVMSVVTRGLSDDAVGWAVNSEWLWLRVSRRDAAFYFHACEDGRNWRLVRQFTLDFPGPVRVGIGVQSPVGEGCAANFDHISLIPDRLDEIFT